jgi:hypothetical protein
LVVAVAQQGQRCLAVWEGLRTNVQRTMSACASQSSRPMHTMAGPHLQLLLQDRHGLTIPLIADPSIHRGGQLARWDASRQEHCGQGVTTGIRWPACTFCCSH